MPFYEYQCEACSAHVEVLQKISDAPLRKCPTCGKQKLKRLLSAPVFRLKGSGWYETDFKSESEAKRNLADHPDKEAKGSEAAEATKPETKAPDTAKAADKVEGKPKESKPPKVGAAGKPKAPTRAVSRAKPKAARRKASGR